MPVGDSALVYGATSLMMTGAENAGYVIEASADGTNWGNPEAVVTAIQSRLQDGSLAVVDSYLNREAPIQLRITSKTFDGLARGEAALVAETRKSGYNTLSWTPSTSMAEPTVFDVVYGVLNHDFDDLMEVQNLRRRFVLTLNCLPFPRLSREIVAAAIAPPPATPTTVSVDTGSSTTGWVGAPGAPAVVSGAVRLTPTITAIDNGASSTGWAVSKDPASLSTNVVSDGNAVTANGNTNAKIGAANVGAVRQGFVSLNGSPFVAIDQVITPGDGYTYTGYLVLVDGNPTPAQAVTPVGNGFYRIWVQPGVASFNFIELRASFSDATAGGVFGNHVGHVTIDQVFSSNVGPSNPSIALTRNGTIDTSSTPYITVDYLNQNMQATAFALNGATVTPIYTLDQGGGLTRAYLKSPGASVSSIIMQATIPASIINAGTPTLSYISIDQINRTDTLPFAGTRRQLTRALPVAGSVRTQGRLSVQHESTALGEVLVYVYVNDGSNYAPPLRPYRTAGGTPTSDASLYSGASDNLNTLVQFDVPVAALPAGNYRLLARLQRATAGTPTLTISTATRVNGTTLPGGFVITATPSVTTAYTIIDLGPMTLPTTQLSAASAGTLRLTIEDAADTNVLMDEAYLVNLDIGTVTQVDCGLGTPASGGPSKRLWLDPATVTNNGRDAVVRGHASDRSDAFNPADLLKGWNHPQFEPPTVKVFTACNALDAAVELRHYPRFLHTAYAVA